MPEGHTLHRLARLHTEYFAGGPVRVSSPQGRFADHVSVDGRYFDRATAVRLAESFETSEDGLTVTFTLREDGRWSNGDPVTAEDFEWSWKRTISPELAADYAYQFAGIAGANEYTACDAKTADCAALRDEVGVTAVDDKTLEVKLTTPQPWLVHFSRASRPSGRPRARTSATPRPTARPP